MTDSKLLDQIKKQYKKEQEFSALCDMVGDPENLKDTAIYSMKMLLGIVEDAYGISVSEARDLIER